MSIFNNYGNCYVCDNKYYKNLRQHEKSNKHIYNSFQYDLNKHIDNMIYAGDIKNEDRDIVEYEFKTNKEGDDRIYNSRNKKDVIDFVKQFTTNEPNY